MTTALDAAVVVVGLVAVWLFAAAADRVLRLVLEVPDCAPRHRLAGHPQPYRAWTQQQRPVMGGLTPTRGDRRRNDAVAARMERRRYELADWIRQVRQDKEQQG